MKKLRIIKNTALLRLFTPLAPVDESVTRWSCKYDLLKSYFRNEKHSRNIEQLDLYISKAAKRRSLVLALEHLSKFQSITNNLQ